MIKIEGPTSIVKCEDGIQLDHREIKKKSAIIFIKKKRKEKKKRNNIARAPDSVWLAAL